jgi:hypothetical protein
MTFALIFAFGRMMKGRKLMLAEAVLMRWLAAAEHLSH